ncbi:hypothetical protein [Streptomyces sp. NPDC056165]|uniref:hypothetical protein n=1 Tax=Streptomyces sp. NPDC056165 TaxID=3345733 RepID=UPI0035DD23BF
MTSDTETGKVTGTPRSRLAGRRPLALQLTPTHVPHPAELNVAGLEAALLGATFSRRTGPACWTS